MAETSQSKWQMRWVPEPTVALAEDGHFETGEILLDVPSRTVTIASGVDASENLTRLKVALDAIGERDGRVIQIRSAPEARIVPLPDDLPPPGGSVTDVD